jgi:hypothetical protein
MFRSICHVVQAEKDVPQSAIIESLRAIKAKNNCRVVNNKKDRKATFCKERKKWVSTLNKEKSTSHAETEAHSYGTYQDVFIRRTLRVVCDCDKSRVGFWCASLLFFFCSLRIHILLDGAHCAWRLLELFGKLTADFGELRLCGKRTLRLCREDKKTLIDVDGMMMMML